MIQIQYPQVVTKIKSQVKVCNDFDDNDQRQIMNEFETLWDTGAVKTIISPKVVADLRLPAFGRGQIRLGNDDGDVLNCTTYVIRIIDPVRQTHNRLEVAAFNIPEVGIIIGMDMISNGEFVIKKINNVSAFTFNL